MRVTVTCGESKGLVRASVICWGSKMERKYLKLSGDYQGEGTHTLPEIGNEKQSHSAGGIPKIEASAISGEI